MTESEAIAEIRFNMSTIGLKECSVKCSVKRVVEARDLALQALEKQVPRKALHSYDKTVHEMWCSCPTCYVGLGWEHGNAHKYCMNYGQKLDWSDEE